jgi:hypothetical protein
VPSKIWDLVFRHFGDLTPLDFGLIVLFTIVFAYAVYRFLDWLYGRRITAQEETIQSYKRLGESYREERNHLEQQNRDLRAAAATLEEALAKLKREGEFTREATEKALTTLYGNYISLLLGYRVALQMNILAQFLLMAERVLPVYTAAWSAESTDRPAPGDLRERLDGVVERFRPMVVHGDEGLPEAADFSRVLRESIAPPSRILTFPGDDLMAPVVEILAFGPGWSAYHCSTGLSTARRTGSSLVVKAGECFSLTSGRSVPCAGGR